MPNGTPEEKTQAFRTPYESAPPPPAESILASREGGPPPETPKPPQIGRMRSEKILIEIKRLRLRILKRLVLALILIVIAALIGTTWRQAFYEGGTATTPAILLALFLAIFPFVALSIKWHALLITNIIAFLFMVAQFVGDIPLWSIPALSLSASVLASFAGLSMAWKAGNLVMFRLNSVIGAGIGLLILSFAMIFTGVYYYKSIAPNAIPQQFFLSEASVENMLRLGGQFTNRFLPGFRSDMSVEEFAGILVEFRKEALLTELREQPGYSALSEEIKRRVEKEFLDRTRDIMIQETFKSIDKPVNKKQELGKFVWDFLASKFLGLSPAAKQIALLGWLFSILIAVVAAGSIIKIFILIIAWILLQIMLGVKFFEIARESSERKVLALS